MRNDFVKAMGLVAVLALCIAALPSLGLAAGGTPAVKQKGGTALRSELQRRRH